MKEPSHVAEVLGEVVLVRVTDSKARAVVQDQGGKRRLFPIRTWMIQYRDDDELAAVLGALRDAGLPFSAGRQWPPSDVFEHLRESGCLSGNYKKIYWEEPGRYQIVEA